MELQSLENTESLKPRQLLWVQADILDTVWWGAVPLLLEGKKYWEEFMTLESIYNSIKSGDLQLWLMNDEDEFLLAMLTQLIRYPKILDLRLVWIGGEDLASGIELFFDYIELWGHRQGASRVTVSGRKGWIRRLLKSGYKLESYTVCKDISEIKEH